MELKYEKPEMDVINIQLIDVITSSGETNSGLIITPSGGTDSGTWEGIDSFGGMF